MDLLNYATTQVGFEEHSAVEIVEVKHLCCIHLEVKLLSLSWFYYQEDIQPKTETPIAHTPAGECNELTIRR